MLFIDFDSTFVKVETIDELAKKILKGKSISNEISNKISNITSKAMNGEISFPDALEQRLELLSITREDVNEVKDLISKEVSDSFIDNKEFIKSISESIWILSGGFKDIIAPIVADYGIKESHVLANTFIYRRNRVVGCDRDNPLAQDRGKIKAINKLNLSRDIVMIGDGFTDYEVYKEKASKAFICYTENICREKIVKLSTYQANSFSDIIEIIKEL